MRVLTVARLANRAAHLTNLPNTRHGVCNGGSLMSYGVMPNFCNS